MAPDRLADEVNGLLLLIIVLALAITALLNRRLSQPGLVVVVLAGAASFIPGMPHLELEPEIILSLVMPPLLYGAALEFSFFSFVRNLRPIVGLGVGLIVVTTFVVANVTVLIVPSLGIGAAFVLAAVVSPPDTVTVVSRGREIGLPSRVVAILTGESLINDATALTIITLTITAVTGAHAFIEQPVLLFAYAVAVGGIVGFVISHVGTWTRERLRNPTLENALGFLLPFAAYHVAESVHASGVIAVVIAGFGVSLGATYSPHAHVSPTAYLTRLQERTFWPVVNALLEALVFAYVGLQLSSVIDELSAAEVSAARALLLSLVVLALVVLVRIAWVFVVFSGQRPPRARPPLDRRDQLLISWCGMRGIVTLAAAASIPLMSQGEPFPGRETIQLVAFVVVLGTLLGQGMTLPMIARRLEIDLAAELADDARERAAGRALVDAIDVRDLDARRAAITAAVMAGELEDEIGRELLLSVDLDQAALSMRDERPEHTVG